MRRILICLPNTIAGRFLLAAVFLYSLASQPALATPELVFDLDTQAVLHATEAGDPWYPASTTKLMTALVAFKALANKEIGPDTPVLMSKRAMSQKSLQSGLSAGRVMTVEDALYAVLVGSANDVAVALAERVAGSEQAFVQRMNAEASNLGMTATHFENANGLHHPEQQTSARDLGILAMSIYQQFPEHRPIFKTSKVVIDGEELTSKNALLTRFQGTLGMKTGFLCSSGRNIVALAERGQRHLMVVVLGATTDRERGQRAAMLLSQAFDGRLNTIGQSVGALQNNLGTSPQDMRMRVCSNQSAAYEAQQNKLYPMGLRGHRGYLSSPTADISHEIRTWQMAPEVNVPAPRAKPGILIEKSGLPEGQGGWGAFRPMPKPVSGEG
ncbi:D-alanyl-D-alanine carboxypeptidase [Roseibium sp. RKSG952]|nr:D-alanyl-D-alanine carboxypeptidase [Roseibium sp. RKSG952]